jgi:hypothetical protein
MSKSTAMAAASLLISGLAFFFGRATRPLEAQPPAPPMQAQRWLVQSINYSYEVDGEDRGYDTTNAILLDTATGDSWIFLPSEREKEQYSWELLEREKLAK